MGRAVEKYAKAVLDDMVSEAKDGIWTGRTTEIVTRHAPMPYYSKVIHALRESGAVELIQRGGGPTPTQYRIINPDADLDVKWQGGLRPKGNSALEHRVEGLEKAVQGVNLGQLASDIMRQIADLRMRIESLEADREAMIQDG